MTDLEPYDPDVIRSSLHHGIKSLDYKVVKHSSQEGCMASIPISTTHAGLIPISAACDEPDDILHIL
jgi:hypothetical protein